MNNTELKTVAETLRKARVMRRGAGLEQFYTMWRAVTRDPEFLRTGYYSTKGIIPIRARKDYGWVRETPNLLWCWAHGEFWVSVKDRTGEIWVSGLSVVRRCRKILQMCWSLMVPMWKLWRYSATAAGLYY